MPEPDGHGVGPDGELCFCINARVLDAHLLTSISDIYSSMYIYRIYLSIAQDHVKVLFQTALDDASEKSPRSSAVHIQDGDGRRRSSLDRKGVGSLVKMLSNKSLLVPADDRAACSAAATAS